MSAAGGPHPAAVCAAAFAALLALGVAARAGALTRLFDFLDYGAGVLSLVSLTSAVLWGLAATDRTLLTSGHRILAQGAHRGLAVSGLGFLALHVWVKIAESQTEAGAAFVPFTDREQPVLIGLGTLAGYLFVSVAVSGAVRSAFATKGRSMWWRALHMGAYPAWGASLVHGLKAGRPASAWVTVAYGLCLAGVAGVLFLRMRARLRAAPARPAPQPSAPQSPGQAPPRNPKPFVRQPAEQSGERLTARLARQLDRRSGSPDAEREAVRTAFAEAATTRIPTYVEAPAGQATSPQPPFTPPVPAQPAYTPTAFPQPAPADPAFAQPAFVQNAFGQNVFGQNAFGQNVFGQSGPAQPDFGQPDFGQPAFGQTAFAQPGFVPPGFVPSGFVQPPAAAPGFPPSFAGQPVGREQFAAPPVIPLPGILSQGADPLADTLLIPTGAVGPVVAARAAPPTGPERAPYAMMFVPGGPTATNDRAGAPFDGGRGRA
ncbi:hypothetical protein [Streptomyces sp. Isolate_45]|uniref:hypothetical protein n=1 Tax=Streptomyces sp. Isolate_45 TaxID=2950111 RepID=UPI002481F02A|nr:hypothetical protein [Streptomyces sp. Isolate_45]MDA5283237.1 hypothetical protein [Streptomyces sp. Isolate_45]